MLNTISEILAYDPHLTEFDLWPHQSPHHTTIKASRGNGENVTLDSYTVPGSLSQNPGFSAAFHAISKQYNWVEHFHSWDTPKAKGDTTKGNLHYSGSEVPATLARIKHNREHAACNILLHEEVTVTCEETGISSTVRLPVPLALHTILNLPYVHALAYPQNTEAILAHYQRHGVDVEKELEAQVLAGMLLTLLRSKGLLLCKNPPLANAFLRAASLPILGRVLRWIAARPSVTGFPALSLYLEDAPRIREVMARRTELSPQEQAQAGAELFLLNYLRACTGESLRDDEAHIVLAKPERKERGVKIYTDKAKAQVRTVQQQVAAGKTHLAALVAAYPGQHTLLLQQVKMHLGMLVYLSASNRAAIAGRLHGAFPACEPAKELAMIFAHTQTGAVEEELMSFTQQTKMELREAGLVPSKVKVDFLSKLSNTSK